MSEVKVYVHGDKLVREEWDPEGYEYESCLIGETCDLHGWDSMNGGHF